MRESQFSPFILLKRERERPKGEEEERTPAAAAVHIAPARAASIPDLLPRVSPGPPLHPRIRMIHSCSSTSTHRDVQPVIVEDEGGVGARELGLGHFVCVCSALEPEGSLISWHGGELNQRGEGEGEARGEGGRFCLLETTVSLPVRSPFDRPPTRGAPRDPIAQSPPNPSPCGPPARKTRKTRSTPAHPGWLEHFLN